MVHLSAQVLSAAQSEEKLKLGPGYRDDELVSRESTAPIHRGYVAKSFDRLAETAGLPGIRLHDLRNTPATLLLDEGIPLKVMSERLGHSSVAITANLYQHVFPHIQDEAAKAAGRALLGS